MAGVLNDYNQQEGEPRTRIGNWVEERALRQATGLARGSTTAATNDTQTRITGKVNGPTDYNTTTELALQNTLTAPHGPTYIESIAPPRRANLREEARLAEAKAIMDQRAREADEQKAAELRYAAFGGREPQNRKRMLETNRSIEDAAKVNPLHTSQAISFHTHHIGSIHGVTPTDQGVHTFSRNTNFSKPISELMSSGER